MVKYRIAISGKMNCGKNTIAEMFADNLKFIGSKEKIAAVADPIKQIIKSIFPEAKDECLYGRSELRSTIINEKYKDLDGNFLTYRKALVDLGAFGRKYYGDIWLNLLVNDGNKDNEFDTYIISDVRFINEFNYLKNAGFTMVRIIRNNKDQINDVSELEQDSIPDSEFDYVVVNDGSIELLKEEVDKLTTIILFESGDP